MDSDKAEFGSSSSGGSGQMFEPVLKLAFERAMLLANEQREPTLGSERLVHTLLDEETVSNALRERGIDVQIVRNSLEGHLQQSEKRAEDTQLEQDIDLQRALQQLISRQFVSRNKRISALDALTEIVEQNESYAATVLIQQGFDVELATAAATEHYIGETQRANEEMSALRLKIANLRESEYTLTNARGNTVAQDSNKIETLTYRLQVTSRDSDTQVEFKGAVSQDGRLKLLIETTPFEFGFVAKRVVALLEAVSGQKGINARLFVIHEDGSETPASGFGGASGVIFQDSRNLIRAKSGRF